MAKNSNSQCYFVQLQIDSFLDGDLGPQQRDEFQTHVHQCSACAQEFKYAQTLHDFILDMPQVDCDDRVLEPIHRLGSAASQQRHYNREGQKLFHTPKSLVEVAKTRFS